MGAKSTKGTVQFVSTIHHANKPKKRDWIDLVPGFIKYPIGFTLVAVFMVWDGMAFVLKLVLSPQSYYGVLLMARSLIGKILDYFEEMFPEWADVFDPIPVPASAAEARMVADVAAPFSEHASDSEEARIPAGVAAVPEKFNYAVGL